MPAEPKAQERIDRKLRVTKAELHFKAEINYNAESFKTEGIPRVDSVLDKKRK